MTRRVPFATGLVITCAVVAASTSHEAVWGMPRDGVAAPSALLSIVGLSALVTLAFSIVALAWMRRSRSHPWHTVLPAAVVSTVLLSLFGISNVDLYPPGPITGVALESTATRPGVRLRSDWRGPATRRDGEDAGRGMFGTADSEHARFARRLLMLAGTLALILFVRARGLRRRVDPVGRSIEPDAGVRVAAHSAIVQTIDGMLADPDPRTAIIGAYARLLEELETSGASREPYEGPSEHLTRVLGVLEVRPDALRTLVSLFEIARFSEHSLTLMHRSSALAALRDVADDLSAPSAGASVSTGSPA